MVAVSASDSDGDKEEGTVADTTSMEVEAEAVGVDQAGRAI